MILLSVWHSDFVVILKCFIYFFRSYLLSYVIIIILFLFLLIKLKISLVVCAGC